MDNGHKILHSIVLHSWCKTSIFNFYFKLHREWLLLTEQSLLFSFSLKCSISIPETLTITVLGTHNFLFCFAIISLFWENVTMILFLKDQHSLPKSVVLKCLFWSFEFVPVDILGNNLTVTQNLSLLMQNFNFVHEKQ